MAHDTLDHLLADIHHSLDRLAEDLSRDRPDLALALRKEATLIPRPERAPPPPPPRAAFAPRAPANCAQLRPLLYRALDEGVLPARRFDALMVRRARAAGILRMRSSG
jgi:hypothetical protein